MIGRIIKVSLSLVLAVFAVCNSVCAVEGQDAAGVVFAKEGEWNIENGHDYKRIEVGDVIPSGWYLRRISESGVVEVGLTDGRRVLCPPKKSDEPNLTKPIVVRTNPSLQSCIAQVIANWIAKSSKRYAITISRGDERHFVKAIDTIVELKDGKIDLKNAFPKGTKSSVTASLSSLDGSNPFASSVVTLGFDKKGSIVFENEKLQPGLYKLSFFERAEKTGEESWVLICASDRYKAKSQSYAKAKQVTSKWAEGATAQTRTALLRAYLDSLASSTSDDSVGVK